MTDLMKSISLAALVAFAAPAVAQESDAPPAETAQPQAPAGEAGATGEVGAAATGQPQDGQPYVAGTFGDWQQRCVRQAEGRDPCQIYQLLRDETGNPTAEISIVPLVNSPPAEASATMITPLETLLTRQIVFRVDQGAAKQYPFTVCMQQACISRIAFTADEVRSLKRGAKATMTIVPFAAPDQTIELTISLTGFTAAYDATRAANAEG